MQPHLAHISQSEGWISAYDVLKSENRYFREQQEKRWKSAPDSLFGQALLRAPFAHFLEKNTIVTTININLLTDTNYSVPIQRN